MKFELKRVIYKTYYKNVMQDLNEIDLIPRLISKAKSYPSLTDIVLS